MANKIWLFECGTAYDAPEMQLPFTSIEGVQKFWDESGLPAGESYHETDEVWFQFNELRDINPVSLVEIIRKYGEGEIVLFSERTFKHLLEPLND